ncbi:MAG: hypothetical protein JSW27_11210, partial [Phycisphaerales bacterium]
LHAYIDSVRIDLAEGNVRLINETIGLSDEEAKVFWPLYQEYETELFELGDRRLDLMDRFIASDEALNLDDSEAQKIAAEWFELEEARFALWKKYHQLIAARLSPLRAIQFVQTEHRISTVVDLMIASELPLFRHGLLSDPAESGASEVPGGDPPQENSQAVAMKASWEGDYPVDALDRLPTGQRESATGYIGDAGTFTAIWRAFKPAEIVPQVDFKSDVVVFARNVHFYNRTRIAKVQMKDGILEILAAETMSAAPIEDKVAMTLAVISRKGVEAVKTSERCLPLSSS